MVSPGSHYGSVFGLRLGFAAVVVPVVAVVVMCVAVYFFPRRNDVDVEFWPKINRPSMPNTPLVDSPCDLSAQRQACIIVRP